MAKFSEQYLIIGYVGKDAESRFTQQGKQVTSFSVAVDKSWTDKDGNKHEKTKWVSVSAWEKLAEITQKYVKKGDLLMVIGEPEAHAYTNKKGELVGDLKVTASTIRFLSSKGDGTSQTSGPEYVADGHEFEFISKEEAEKVNW